MHFPERARWLPKLEVELFSFPGSRYNDQVDSISMALNHVKSSPVWIWKRLDGRIAGEGWPCRLARLRLTLEPGFAVEIERPA